MEVHGDTKGIKKYILDQLNAIYDLQIPLGQISTNEINEKMLEITEMINREVAVYINRQGKVMQVAIGDTSTISLPEIKERTSSLRLSGIRCIHTHPSGDTTLSQPDLSSLRRMRFDAMVAIGKQDSDMFASIAFFTGEYDEDDVPQLQGLGPTSLAEIHQINLTYLTMLIDKQLAKHNALMTLDDEERTILAGIDLANSKSTWTIEDSLKELEQLAETAGAKIVATVTQKKDRPDMALFFGKGKIQEISMLIQETNANMIVFDDELSPSQQRNIELLLGIKVLDRTALILDIFAQRARSHEGKLQVELAQLRYALPRISGQGLVLSRLGGGIGTRGPGETKLEVDRRHIRSKINDIEKQIEAIKKQRQLHRENRESSNISTVALVGYTNSGKSTLLNALTGSDVFAEDKLFATLDPTTRQVTLSTNQKVLITDTVGFIQKLPHHLVSAFRATLEEVQSADLLLHVIDSSQINYKQQMDSVVTVLRELKTADKPTLNVFNKIDNLTDEDTLKTMLTTPDSIGISAKKNIHLDLLKTKIEEYFAGKNVDLELLIPYAEGSAITLLHEIAMVQSTEYNEIGTLIKASVPREEINKFKKYMLEETTI